MIIIIHNKQTMQLTDKRKTTKQNSTTSLEESGENLILA